MSNKKKNYLFVVFALLFMVIVAVSVKVVSLNVDACNASGKMLAETFENSSPAVAGSSFKPQVFIIAFLLMVGGALGMVFLNSQMQNRNNKEHNKSNNDNDGYTQNK